MPTAGDDAIGRRSSWRTCARASPSCSTRDHPIALHRLLVHVRGLRPVERPAAAVLHPGAPRDRSSSTACRKGLTSLGFVVGSLFMARFATAAAGARLDRRLADRDGHHRRPLRAVDDGPVRDRDGDPLGLPPTAILGLAIRPDATQYAEGGARSRLLRLLRDARRDLPVRHGRRRSGRHRRHPAAHLRRRRACSSCPPRSRWSPRASVCRPGVPARPASRPAAAPALAASPFRPATLADFDRLVGRLSTFARLSVRAAGCLRRRGDHPRRAGRDAHRRARATRRRPRTSSSRARRRPASPSRAAATTASPRCSRATSSARSRP